LDAAHAACLWSPPGQQQQQQQQQPMPHLFCACAQEPHHTLLQLSPPHLSNPVTASLPLVYPQAYLNKYYGGRNALIFAPAELRDLANDSSAHEGSEPRFADLSGLGKIVLSNIRTPKMLMDVSGGSAATHGGKGGKDGAVQQAAEGKAKPLEQVGLSCTAATAAVVLCSIILLTV
jgi:hypothetical protein